MTEIQTDRPWESIEEIARSGDGKELGAFVESLSPADAARAMAHLDIDDQNRVLETLPAGEAAHLIEDLPDAQAADLIEHLAAPVAAAIIEHLPSDERADLIGDLHDTEAEAILSEMSPQSAQSVRDLARFDENTAGGLMVTEFLRFNDDSTVGDVVDELRRGAETYADYDIQYAYVVDRDDRLVGVLRLRDLLLTPNRSRLDSIMVPDPARISAHAVLDEIADHFERIGFLALPVVDEQSRLVGLVHRAALAEALSERAEADHMKAKGIVGGEELRTMPLLRRSRRRLSWLSVNIVLNVIAASVIAVFEDTLASVIALAFFLPIISDMSGCSGNQAVAVSIRELTLGLVRPVDLMYVWLKEIGVGILNGAVLGAIIGLVAFIWKGNEYLGFVVGAALAANTVVAVSIGGLVPLVLKRFNLDPALASGPVLTTITDICGFFFTLGFATVLLTQLTA